MKIKSKCGTLLKEDAEVSYTCVVTILW